MIDNLTQLKKEIDNLTKRFNEFKDKPYLIKGKDLTKSIFDAITPIFSEKEKINLIRAIVISAICEIVIQATIFLVLYFKFFCK
jgi:hypothetical protein